MIEGVRSLGMAARFVSGYIFLPDADPRLAVGRGATHAWLQVYLPGMGWVDFDPTNKIIGNHNLIRVAVAWNLYRQAGGFPGHGGRRKRSRRDPFINGTVAGRERAPGIFRHGSGAHGAAAIKRT
jgi:hypothetical protein